MISVSAFGPHRAVTRLAAVLALMPMALAIPAKAADPVFPPGSRLGLVPPAGMTASTSFPGFTDPDKDAVIILATLPAAAYSKIEKTLDAETVKKEGITLEKRELMPLDAGTGVLLTGRQVADKVHYRKWLLLAVVGDLTAVVNVQAPEEGNAYSDRAVRAALATLVARATIPEAEELSLLPFTIGDLAGFHVAEVVRGRAVILSDAPSESTKDSSKDAPRNVDAHLLLAALPGGPADPNDHANFARLAFREITGIRDIQVTMSEPLRISNQSGYQTMAQAKDARSGTDVMVVQWLRFGSGGFLQMVGVAPTEKWTGVLARLRAVRDSIEAK